MVGTGFKKKTVDAVLQNRKFIHSSFSSSKFEPYGHTLWIITEKIILFILIMIQNKSFCKVRNLLTFVKGLHSTASSGHVLPLKIIWYITLCQCSRDGHVQVLQTILATFHSLISLKKKKSWSCWFRVLKSGTIKTNYFDWAKLGCIAHFRSCILLPWTRFPWIKLKSNFFF